MSSKLAKEAAFESSFKGFFYRQKIARQKPIPAGTTLAGQTVIVTGSNSGIGLEASRQLLRLNPAKLIIAVRSLQKGESAAKGLRKEFAGSQIEVWELDMVNYESITAFVKRCETLERIGVVILNAGLIKGSFEVVKSTGHEETLQVNFLSTMLLAGLLLPVLKERKPEAAKPTTLTIVSSDGVYGAKISKTGSPMALFKDAKDFSPIDWYYSAKLLLTLFVTKLAAQVNPDDVLINLSCPGFCAPTGLGRDSFGVVMRAFFRTFQFLMARTPQTGASVLVYAAVAQGKESHGSYVSEWAIRPYPAIAYTQEGHEIIERLWEETMEEFKFAHLLETVQNM